MKSRIQSKSLTSDNKKVPVCISLNKREIRTVDKASKRRGFKKRSAYILWLILKDAKR